MIDKFSLYQKIADSQRQRHMRNESGWPGKPLHTYAETKYPNILAEMDGSMRWLCTVANLAHVTEEIMAAVMEDGEDLSTEEIIRFGGYWEHKGLGYLLAPTLQVVDPTTNKGKARRRALADKIKEASGAETDVYGEMWMHRAKNVLDVLLQGKGITYATYWWSIYNLQLIINQQKARAYKPRGRRLNKA